MRGNADNRYGSINQEDISGMMRNYMGDGLVQEWNVFDKHPKWRNSYGNLDIHASGYRANLALGDKIDEEIGDLEFEEDDKAI